MTQGLVPLLIGFAGSLAGCSAPRVVTAGPASPPAAAAVRFGIAAQVDGHTCLSIADARLSPGTRAKLVFPDEQPQSTADVVVDRPSPRCTSLAEPDTSGYELRVTGGYVAPNAEAIAVLHPARFTPQPDGIMAATIEPGARFVTFRSCESAEGVHLTVWAGTSLKSERLWHGYHHLDYDVGANCTDKDTAP